MVVITCPECGAVLNSDVVNLEAHCMSHWGVPPKDVGKIPNTQAQERYRAIMSALNDAEPNEAATHPNDPLKTGDIIEGVM